MKVQELATLVKFLRFRGIELIGISPLKWDKLMPCALSTKKQRQSLGVVFGFGVNIYHVWCAAQTYLVPCSVPHFSGDWS